MLEIRNLSYSDGPVPVPVDDSFLAENVERISICDTGLTSFLSTVPFYEVSNYLSLWFGQALTHQFNQYYL